MTLDQKGVLHVPLSMLTALIVVTGLALWALLHHWKNLTQTQLRLDHCTGETALDLKSRLLTIAGANQQIQGLRISEMAAAISPPAAASIRAMIELEALHQEEIRVGWTVKQLQWAVVAGCGRFKDRSSPLPDLTWNREPPDGLGAQPLRLEDLPDSFQFEIQHSPRASAAEVSRGDNDDTSSDSWHARWIAPNRLLGASLH